MLVARSGADQLAIIACLLARSAMATQRQQSESQPHPKRQEQFFHELRLFLRTCVLYIAEQHSLELPTSVQEILNNLMIALGQQDPMLGKAFANFIALLGDETQHAAYQQLPEEFERIAEEVVAISSDYEETENVEQDLGRKIQLADMVLTAVLLADQPLLTEPAKTLAERVRTSPLVLYYMPLDLSVAERINATHDMPEHWRFLLDFLREASFEHVALTRLQEWAAGFHELSEIEMPLIQHLQEYLNGDEPSLDLSAFGARAERAYARQCAAFARELHQIAHASGTTVSLFNSTLPADPSQPLDRWIAAGGRRIVIGAKDVLRECTRATASPAFVFHMNTTAAFPRNRFTLHNVLPTLMHRKLAGPASGLLPLRGQSLDRLRQSEQLPEYTEHLRLSMEGDDVADYMVFSRHQ